MGLTDRDRLEHATPCATGTDAMDDNGARRGSIPKPRTDTAAGLDTPTPMAATTTTAAAATATATATAATVARASI